MAIHFPDDMTLTEARELLRTLIGEGHKCPCCSQNAKVYQRKISRPMARTLVRLAESGGITNFVHAPSMPGDNHEVSQLSWWGLIADEGSRREDGGRAGYWRITEAGRQFLSGETRVSKYAKIYDGRVLGFDGPEVSIDDALGEAFHFGELMASIAVEEDGQFTFV